MIKKSVNMRLCRLKKSFQIDTFKARKGGPEDMKQDQTAQGKKSQGPEVKSRFRQIIDGDREPEGPEKGYKNLLIGQTVHNIKNMTPEERSEFSRKGAAAVQALHGEKKTARESLERLLTLKVTPEIIAGADLPEEIAQRLRRDNPDATLYDLIQLVAVGRAVGGSIRAAEYVRDTHGDKPADRVQVQQDIMTDQDREMLARIADRIAAGDHLEVVRDV